MRTSIIISIMLHSLASYSQETRIANLILVIDEKLVVGSVANLRIINDKGTELEGSHYPGRLNFGQQDFDRMISEDDSLMLVFDYYETTQGKQLLYNYKLHFGKHWLNKDFLIMKVYNLQKNPYKKMYDPLDSERKYTFELIYPGGQMLRVKGSENRKK